LTRRAESNSAALIHVAQMVLHRREQGRLEDMEATLVDHAMRFPAGKTFRCVVALLYSESGRIAEASREFASLAANDFDDIPRSFVWTINLVFLSEVCATLVDDRRAAILYRLLSPYARQNALGSSAGPCWGSISRSLGLLATTLRRWDEAARHFEMSLHDHERIGARPWLARTQHDYAHLLLSRGQPGDRPKAADLLHRALEAARSMGMVRLSEQALSLVKQFDLERFGAQLSGDSSRMGAGESAGIANPDRLTDREVAVLQLLAHGKSNKQIAEDLVLSVRTVEHHVAHLYAKIGAHGRVDATTYALRNGLVPPRPMSNR
ncbi:MAG TPA: response regulator transcription factor, partial [Chloroflexota bacterium]|nr:response regulator transcription factor [Chloroflexota bacterium]